jgi:hypothetical protein
MEVADQCISRVASGALSYIATYGLWWAIPRPDCPVGGAEGDAKA